MKVQGPDITVLGGLCLGFGKDVALSSQFSVS